MATLVPPEVVVMSKTDTDANPDDSESRKPALYRCIVNPRGLLVSLSVYAFVQGFVVTGLVSSSLSSIQQRFGLSSTTGGVILAVYEAAVLSIVIPVSHIGGSLTANRNRYLALGLFILGLGAFVWTIPHMVGGTYEPAVAATGSGTQMCDAGNGERCSDQESQRGLLAFFLIGQLLIGFGSSPLYPLSPAELQCAVPKRVLPLYVGVFYSATAFGPAAGYMVAGLALSTWVDAGSPPGNLTSEDPAWVGAWWIGFSIAATMGILFSIPLFMFPKHLPGTEAIRAEVARSRDAVRPTPRPHRGRSRSSAGSGAAADPSPVTIGEPLPFLESCITIAKNKPFMFNTLGSLSEAFVVSGVAGFLPSLLEAQFALTSSRAALLTGVAAIPGAVGGMILGGWVVKRFNMSTKATMQFVWVVALVAFCCMCFLFLGCDTPLVVGVNQPYAGQTTPSLSPSCLAGCACSSVEVFDPVCGSDGRTYFSPCYAGCTNLTAGADDAFYSCGCMSDDTSGAFTATTGYCPDDCKSLVPFLLLLVILMLTTFTNTSPAISVITQVVPGPLVALALSLGAVVWRLGGSIPGPILVGSLIDDACLHDEELCSGDNHCIAYDNSQLRDTVALVALGGKGLSCLFFFLSWLSYDPSDSVGSPNGSPRLLDNDGEDARTDIATGDEAKPTPVLADPDHDL